MICRGAFPGSVVQYSGNVVRYAGHRNRRTRLKGLRKGLLRVASHRSHSASFVAKYARNKNWNSTTVLTKIEVLFVESATPGVLQ